MLAVVTFVQHFKQYLLGRKFIIRTDHSAIRWVMSFKEPENQMARWIEILSQFDFSVVHRPGSKHGNADFLSRACEPSSCDCYDGQTVLSDLPCSGCSDCLKKHEQWSSFMMLDDVIPLKLNRNKLVGTEMTSFNRMTKGLASRFLTWLSYSFFLSLLRAPGVLINQFSHFVNNKLSRGHLRSQSVKLKDGDFGCNGQNFTFRLPSYIVGYTDVDLAKLQKNDPEVGTVIKWMETSTERPSRETVTSESQFTRHLWLLWTQLVLVDGILYKIWYPKLKECFLQLIAPRKLWSELLEAARNSKFSGHLGHKKVLSKLKMNFYWFRMKEYIKTWIKKCSLCGARKTHGKRARAPLGHYLVGAPMDRVSTDIMGPFPVSERGCRYILVVQDQFSKWVEAYPIRDQSAETVARVLVHEFFSRFGVPLELHSDQRSNYGSELFKEVCKLLEIHKTRTTPYHPSSNGMVERFNHTLLNMISAYVSENQRDWDVNLSLLTSAYRSCSHGSSGLSPNLVMLGREVHQPISLKFGFPGVSQKPISPSEYVCYLWNSMCEIQQYVREHLGIAAERQKRDYDMRISINSYKVGDLVYYLDSKKKIGLNPKLKREPWKGPFVVMRKISDLLYEISGPTESKKRVMHHDRLKPYYCDTIPDWVPAVQKSALQKRTASEPMYMKNKRNGLRNPRQKRNADELQQVSVTKTPTGVKTRPKRERKAPCRYGYD